MQVITHTREAENPHNLANPTLQWCMVRLHAGFPKARRVYPHTCIQPSCSEPILPCHNPQCCGWPCLRACLGELNLDPTQPRHPGRCCNLSCMNYPDSRHACGRSVCRGCANLMARAAGRQVSPGAVVPYEDLLREVVGPCAECSSRYGVALTSYLPSTFSLILYALVD